MNLLRSRLFFGDFFWCIIARYDGRFGFAKVEIQKNPSNPAYNAMRYIYKSWFLLLVLQNVLHFFTHLFGSLTKKGSHILFWVGLLEGRQ